MDFRQCPACQASVLDDDATDCPFCGASMSGKPSAAAAPKAAASPPSRPAEKATKSADASKKKAPARKVGETVADEDDPFGIEAVEVSQVPKMAPKPAKGRMIRIQCPMCETPGFISSKMQGRDVRCCNPECMVPVFKAPRPERKQEDTNQQGGLTGKTIGIAAGVFLLLGGLLFWGFYWSRQQGTTVQQPTQPTYEYDPELTGGGSTPKPANDNTEPVAPQPVSLAEIKRQALNRIVTAAQVRDDNRKAYGRRMAAEAHALAGELTAAREQLTQLQKPSVGGRVPYFQVEPLVLIAWQLLEKGQAAEANQAVQQAIEAYDRLSQVGRQVITAGIALAAAQAAFDQSEEAKQTIRDLEANESRSRVAAQVHIVEKLETFDVEELLKATTFGLTGDPLAVAVATDIAAHQRWENAVSWARAQPGLAAREDSLALLAAFAGLHSGRTQDSAAADLLQGVTGLSPAGPARIQASIAAGHLMAGDQSSAQAGLAAAIESLGTIPKPEAVGTPGIKQVHDSEGKPNDGLPQAEPLHSAAAAALQIAQLQALLGQNEAAWTTLLKAWDFTVGIGPDRSAITAMSQELDKNRRRTESKLRRELNLRTDDEEFRALNQYRRQLRHFEEAAEDRFQLEQALLASARRLGLASQVDAFRKNPGSAVASAAKQPYEQALSEDSLHQTLAEVERQFAAGKIKQAAQILSGINSRSMESARDQLAVELGCRLIKQKNVDGLLTFVDSIKDPWLAEDVLELASALSVLRGAAPDLWKKYGRHDLQPTEKVALYRGLVAGIVSHERRPHSQSTASTPQSAGSTR